MWVKTLRQQIVNVIHSIKTKAAQDPLGTIIIAIATIFILATIILFTWIVLETIRADNLGFGSKSFWDWMDLLVAPTIIAIATILVARFVNEMRASRKDREVAEFVAARTRSTQLEITQQSQQQQAFDDYIQLLTDLLLEEKLASGLAADSTLQAIIRARTLGTLRAVSSEQKRFIIEFLHTANLIKHDQPVVVLKGTDLSHANLADVNLSKSNLDGVDLSSANLNGVDLTQASLRGSNMTDTNLQAGNLTKADLTSANLRMAKMERCRFSGSLLFGSDLRNASLKNATLIGADLRNANLTDVNLEDVDLRRANLSEANFTRATLTGADLTEATVNGANFANVTYDEQTSWPKDFRPPNAPSKY